MVEQVDTGTTGNFSDIDQTASGSNTAEVSQLSGTTGSFADITQDGSSDRSIAAIDQVRNANSTAEIFQTDTTLSFANIRQGEPGSSNAAVIVQGDTSAVSGTVSGSFNAVADITQSGDDNFALSIQAGGFTQLSVIRQDGAFGPGSGNSAQVVQGAFSGVLNDASIDQSGSGDTAEIAQNSDSGDADIFQRGSGTGNFSLIDQGFFGGGNGNTALSNQIGSGNRSGIEQNALTAGGSNNASARQEGNDNTSFIFQEGTSNTATVNQLTDGNSSTVNQNGTGNTATVNQ